MRSARRRTDHGEAGWRVRLRLLPQAPRVLGLVLLGCAAAPAVARTYASLGEGALALALREHLAIVPVAALALACVSLVTVERPRSLSPSAYARQLRERFLELQSDFDAGLRRRPGEGKENEDDVQHPFEA